MICQFSFTSRDDGQYDANCAVCGRSVVTRTTKAVASCFKSPRKMTPPELAQAAGVVQKRPPIVAGAGTELKRLLREWLRITPTEGCSCNAMAARMDALGPDWCESDAGMAEILRVMRDEHTKRWADGRTRIPWTDFVATKLVRLACRRARKNR